MGVLQSTMEYQLNEVGRNNVMGVNYVTREFRLDHYLSTDGPTLDEVAQHLKNQFRIRELKRELGIFNIR